MNDEMIQAVRILCLLPFGLPLILPVASDETNATNSTENPSGKDSFCEAMKRGDSKKVPFLIAGLLKKRLIFVTTDYKVYELNITSLSEAMDKLYLDATPIPMATKYPELWNETRFQETKAHLFDAFTAMDSVSDYLLFTTREIDYSKSGVNFDLKQRKVLEGYTYSGRNFKQYISASTTLRFYCISNMTNGISIVRFKFSAKTVSESEKIRPILPYKALCFDGKDQSSIFMHSSEDSCPKGSTRVKWPFYKGFVDNDKFYLFSDEDVRIFPEQVVIKGGSKHPVKIVKFKDFFLCKGDYIPPEFYDATGIGFIFIILLIILIIILLCCLYIGKLTYDRHKRKQTFKDHSRTSSAHSGSQSMRGSTLASSRKGSLRSGSSSKSALRSVGTKASHTSVGVSSRRTSLSPSRQASVRSSGSHSLAKGSNSLTASKHSSVKKSFNPSSRVATVRTSGSRSRSTSARSKKTSVQPSASNTQTRRSGLSNSKR